MPAALADFWTSAFCMTSVHPGIDLVAELVGAVHLQGTLGVVGGVHPAGVRVAPGALQVGAVGEGTASGSLEQRVDRVDRALRAEHLVAADLQSRLQRDL